MRAPTFSVKYQTIGFRNLCVCECVCVCKNEFCSFLHLSFVCLLLWLPLLPEYGECT